MCSVDSHWLPTEQVQQTRNTEEKGVRSDNRDHSEVSSHEWRPITSATHHSTTGTDSVWWAKGVPKADLEEIPAGGHLAFHTILSFLG